MLSVHSPHKPAALLLGGTYTHMHMHTYMRAHAHTHTLHIHTTSPKKEPTTAT